MLPVLENKMIVCNSDFFCFISLLKYTVLKRRSSLALIYSQKVFKNNFAFKMFEFFIIKQPDKEMCVFLLTETTS